MQKVTITAFKAKVIDKPLALMVTLRNHYNSMDILESAKMQSSKIKAAIPINVGMVTRTNNSCIFRLLIQNNEEIISTGDLKGAKIWQFDNVYVVIKPNFIIVYRLEG